MKVGVVQMSMSWTLEENIREISRICARYSYLDLLIFPELSTAGFHREVLNHSNQESTRQAIDFLASSAYQARVNIMVGALTYCDDAIYNSYLLLGHCGTLLSRWHKVGLTPSERRIFSEGSGRSNYSLNGLDIGVVICREIDDIDWFLNEVSPDMPDIIIWPGYMEAAPRSLSGCKRDQAADAKAPKALSDTTNAILIQCNWPHALNFIGDKDMGGSQILKPGDAPLYMPANKVCIGIYDTLEHDLEVVDI
ncbi:Carbon-nitrogen hydrolase [Grimontia celer]|uniref:Carbon-nitrogen hydrolase n=1 Tax=Grimontia celer TaxID=1796497 RepID=A0A128F3Y0_9GAMM|nr:nitrilase-related carbon-nitrogen hydrolase [Grimontia celer]CZF80976.1 Carbon-nitrogen hydrolase [Grimontia celer]